MLKKFVFIGFCFFVWAALAAGVIFLGWQKIVPGGKKSFIQDFKADNYFLGKLSPAERAVAGDGGGAKIIGNPVYFSLKPPRQFSKVRVTLVYRVKDGCAENETGGATGEAGKTCKNNTSRSLPIIEAGILTDRFWHYSLKPLKNTIISELEKKWYAVENQGITLLQRKKKFSGLNDFLANPPATKEIAVYNYDFAPGFKLSDYAAQKNISVLPAKLRGKYEFFVYLKNENLELSLDFLDLNKNTDSDPIKITITGQGRTIANEELPDDSNTSDNGLGGRPGPISFRIPGLPEGAYKVEITANDDIITESLKTGQLKIAFIRKVHIYEAVFPLKLITDSDGIALQTNNPASLGKAAVGKESLDVNETYRQFEKCLSAKNTEITLLKKDTLISGDGIFSFSSGALFNPGVKKITPCFNPDQSGVNYIIADYNPSKQENSLIDGEASWKSASADFNLSGAYSEKGKYSFMVSVPGLKAEDEINDAVLIREIRVELEGKSLWEKANEVIKSTSQKVK
ncbi:MAG: hypothetical protein WCW25_00435 [Patescibacteria group bacterium]|jgi:hypothetical protein